MKTYNIFFKNYLGFVTRQSTLALIDQAVSSSTNFLTGVIIGRACTKEQFGLYMLGLGILSFVGHLETSLILMPYMVFNPRLKIGDHARYTGSTLIHQFGLSALSIVVLTFGGVVLSFGIGPQGLTSVVWTLDVVITFIILRDYIRQTSFANLRIKTVLFLDLGVSVVQISGLLLLASFGIISASSVFWVIGFACGLSAAGWLLWNRKKFAFHITWAISDLVQNWVFGKWVLASGLMWVLSMELYPWILTAFHGIASNGVWAACIGIAAIGNPILLGIQNILGPEGAHSYADGGAIGVRRFMFKASAVSLLVIAPFCLLLMSYGGSLVVTIYGDKYAGNGLVVFVLAMNVLVSTVVFSYSRALYTIERGDLDFAANLVGLFLLLTLGLWLVKSFGPLGAACGLLAGSIGSSAVRYLLFIRLVRPVSMQGIEL